MSGPRRKLKFDKKGRLCENPAGLFVIINHEGRDLLGQVQRCYRRETPSAMMLEVRHFNGEPWPFEPAATAVEVLDSNWKSAYFIRDREGNYLAQRATVNGGARTGLFRLWSPERENALLVDNPEAVIAAEFSTLDAEMQGVYGEENR